MDLTPIVSLASGGHPLIDIDLTAAVQFALFLITVYVSNKLLFQPYLQLRERRKAGIEGARAEAERMIAESEAKHAEQEKKLAAARDQAAEEGRKIRLEAAAYEQEVTDKARRAAQDAMDAAQKRVRSETEAARAELLPQAEALARSMSSRLLGREVA
jgi:F0F1-type ATP synthase membrane subunit b/b'